MVDVNLKSYFEVHNWLKSLTPAPDRDTQLLYNQWIQSAGNNSKYSDAILNINNNQNISTSTIQFLNCWPSSLSELQFDTELTPNDIMKAEATFRYTYYVPK